LKLTVESLKCSKPGYSLLSKRRGKVQRIIEPPKKLNKKMAKLESDELKHSMYKSKSRTTDFVKVEVPLIYKHTSPYAIFT
jgi:hypothetical protein